MKNTDFESLNQNVFSRSDCRSSGQCWDVSIYFDILQISLIEMTQPERTDHSLDRKCYVSGGGTSENLDSIDVLRSVNMKG